MTTDKVEKYEKKMKTHCSLMGLGINTGLCYDIQMIRGKSINPDILDEKIDYNKANELCPKCKYNPLPEPNNKNKRK